MVQIDVTYEGGLRCSATHGPSGEKLFTDAPVDNHGKGESFSPTDLCATALATCMPTVIGIFAERHDIDLKGMTVRVGKIMTAEPPRRIAKLELEINVPIAEDHKHREALERAALTCPVHKSLLAEIEIPVKFNWVG
ncbi:MAG: OsmC family protein [Verrucomicrobiota bacterium]